MDLEGPMGDVAEPFRDFNNEGTSDLSETESLKART